MNTLIKKTNKKTAAVIAGAGLVGLALVVPAVMPESVPDAVPFVSNSVVGPNYVETNDEIVVYVRTWGCENWAEGQKYWWNTQVQPADGAKCPVAGGGAIILMTDESRMGTMTIMGPLGVENEILLEDWERGKRGESKMNKATKEEYRERRAQDIEEALAEARTYEYKK